MNFTFVPQLSGIGFLALALSYLGVAALRRWAEQRRILDFPNERSSHTRPTPFGGGLPARIFMGDVGSAFLGYTFAVLPIIAAQKDLRFALIGVLLVWPFVFDTAFTFFRRLLKGENVFSAHRSHLYQRLVIVGHSHRFVTLLYIVLASIGFILALTWFLRVPGSDAAVTIFLPALCLALWLFVIHQERKHKVFC